VEIGKDSIGHMMFFVDGMAKAVTAAFGSGSNDPELSGGLRIDLTLTVLNSTGVERHGSESPILTLLGKGHHHASPVFGT